MPATACTTKVSAWLGGQLLLGGHHRHAPPRSACGCWVFPYFYVLALIAGIGEMIPIVGPLLAAIPAVAVALVRVPPLALGVAVFFFLQQQVENHVLVPKVMARQVGVSPVRRDRARCSSAARCSASSARFSRCRPPRFFRSCFKKLLAEATAD